MTAKELLPLIRVSSKDDKFSQNLMAWVKKWNKTRHPFPLKAAFLHWSNIDGSRVEMEEGKTQAPQILLGHLGDDGWFAGARLSTIIGSGAGAEVYAFPPSRFDMTPLLGWFDGYIKGGKCFIDPEHRLYHDMWQIAADGESRTCQWCGYAQRKVVTEKVVTETRWVSGQGA